MIFVCTLLSLYATLLVANPLPSDPPDLAITPRDGDDCSNLPGFVEPGETVGNQQSGRWCAAKWRQGIFPNEIEAWASKGCLNWIRIKFTDGTEQAQGNKPGDDGHHRTGTVRWDPWIHTFSKFSLWDGGWNNGVGRIVLEVNGQGMDAGKYWDSPPAEHNAARGTENQGMLLGIEGSSGDCIDTLKPIFSKYRPDKVVLKDATFEPTFEQLNERPYDQRMMTAAGSGAYLRNDLNDTDVTVKVKLDIATEHQTKVTTQEQSGWEHGWEAGLTYGHEVSVQAGVPVANVDTKNKFEVSGKYVAKHVQMSFKGTEDMQLTRITKSYEASVAIKPGKIARCSVVAMQSHVNLRYRATLEHSWKNGESFTYPTTGSFENADSSEAVIHCGDVERADAGIALLAVMEDGIFCPADGRKVSENDPTQVIDGLACSGVVPPPPSNDLLLPLPRSLKRL
ncbi:hypothetical protein P154DRAFT_449430 [Amniculicola lignicola CBS 123094]|uniref:Jacalin-type lectin domain-containing protein n=1 Tax=Amniculicola lignicola CBS 123094 TaxID=1392246 RepID=A0A6A5VVE3_9PLEO|nr:hypothetical protein P154DRAFT_449430 [Amniculicola lignicola CBS 123094]